MSIRVTLVTLLLFGAAGVAEAQHESKPAQAHGAPATGKAPGHDAKAAAPAPHAVKPAAPEQGHAPASPSPKSPAPRSPAPTSAQQAVAQVMRALDRELGPVSAESPRSPRRRSSPSAKSSKIAVTWKTQLVWPEAEAPEEPVRLHWPDPVLESTALRFSYIGLPK